MEDESPPVIPHYHVRFSGVGGVPDTAWQTREKAEGMAAHLRQERPQAVVVVQECDDEGCPLARLVHD